jgi:hypothetical protein
MTDHTRRRPIAGVESMGKPATYLSFHGLRSDLATVAATIDQSWTVLSSLGVLPCGPDGACHRLDLVVLGDFTDTDMADIMTALGYVTGPDIAHLN